MTAVEIDGARVNYEHTGGQPVSGQSPIIFLHGLGHSTYSWRHVVGPLSEYAPVYALDLPGHGQSAPIPGSYHPRALAGHVYRWWQSLALPPAIWVGSSLGTDITLWMAIDHPDAVDRLVLMNGGGYPEKKKLSERLIRWPIVCEILFGSRFGPGMWRNIIRSRFKTEGMPEDEELDEMVRRISAPGVLSSFRRALRAIDRTELGPRLREIKAPTYLIWGDSDVEFPMTLADRLRRDISGARLTAIKGCGQYPQQERPNETVAALVRVVRSTPTGRVESVNKNPSPPVKSPGHSPRRDLPHFRRKQRRNQQ
ncbi:MAG TPA: alpha/beta hydrolase [Chloroflexota bacterium]|nr:alpha/beta hydrolase [Chloroflexota bacterium]